MTVEEMITLYDNFGPPGALAVRESPLLCDREVMASAQVAPALIEWWPRIRKLLEVAEKAKTMHAEVWPVAKNLNEVDAAVGLMQAIAALEATP